MVNDKTVSQVGINKTNKTINNVKTLHFIVCGCLLVNGDCNIFDKLSSIHPY